MAFNALHILRAILFGAIVFALPLLVGKIFRLKTVSLTCLSGQLLLWAVFQVIAVLCINLRTTFDALFWLYSAVVVMLAGFEAMVMRSQLKDRMGREQRPGWKSWVSPFLIIAMLVIAYQMAMYVFKMHLDEDDARWIAEANDALVKNRMLLHNPATGEYIGRFVGEMTKDVFSPWSMYLAWLSRVTGIKAVVIAHTFYPPILLGLSYSAYYEIGCQLFKGKQERGIFLLMVSVLNLFMAGNAYTQSVFTLTRIWQGKAVVAAVMIPTIMAIILRVQYRDEIRDWVLLIMAGGSCCLFSGMGIAIGLLLLGIYGLYVVVCMMVSTARHSEHKWKDFSIRAGLWLASLMPGIMYGLSYLCLKG